MNRKNSLPFIFNLLLLCIFYISFPEKDAFGKELGSEWLTAVSYNLTLSVWDKLHTNETHKVKYIVKADHDLIFVAEREGIAKDMASVEVVYPDDFFLIGTKEKAWVNGYGQVCTWEIYVDNVLMKNGTISLKNSRADDPKKDH